MLILALFEKKRKEKKAGDDSSSVASAEVGADEKARGATDLHAPDKTKDFTAPNTTEDPRQ